VMPELDALDLDLNRSFNSLIRKQLSITMSSLRSLKSVSMIFDYPRKKVK